MIIGARFIIGTPEELDNMATKTTITKTLAELEASGANEHARSIRVHELTLRELWDELREIVDAVPDHGHEGVSRTYKWDGESTPAANIAAQKARGFPALDDATRLTDIRYRWISVFPVTGGNEGHYIHVDLIWQREYQEGRVPLFLLKTFGGHAEAIALAGLLCRVLGV